MLFADVPKSEHIQFHDDQFFFGGIENGKAEDVGAGVNAEDTSGGGFCHGDISCPQK